MPHFVPVWLFSPGQLKTFFRYVNGLRTLNLNVIPELCYRNAGHDRGGIIMDVVTE